MEEKMASEAKVSTPQSETPRGDEESHWILLKDISIPMGHQFITMHRGEVVDDVHVINSIKRAWEGKRLPMREISLRDLLDRGLL